VIDAARCDRLVHGGFLLWPARIAGFGRLD
jgi:hypothetical protein